MWQFTTSINYKDIEQVLILQIFLIINLYEIKSSVCNCFIIGNYINIKLKLKKSY